MIKAEIGLDGKCYYQDTQTLEVFYFADHENDGVEKEGEQND